MKPEIKSLKVLGTKEAFQMIVKMSSFYQKKKKNSSVALTFNILISILYQNFAIIRKKDLCLCRYSDLQCA